MYAVRVIIFYLIVSLSSRIKLLVRLPVERLEQFYFALYDPEPLKSTTVNGLHELAFAATCLLWENSFRCLRAELGAIRAYRGHCTGKFHSLTAC
jgi:hypothetical protein